MSTQIRFGVSDLVIALYYDALDKDGCGMPAPASADPGDENLVPHTLTLADGPAV
jgi:hypothetical protein